MRFYEKILILLLAICVSVLGFNLIASSSVCLLTTARAADLEPLKNYSASCDAKNIFSFEFIAQNPSQLKQPRTSSQLSHLNTYLLEENRSYSSRITQDQ
jgi:hypothetical protein